MAAETIIALAALALIILVTIVGVFIMSQLDDLIAAQAAETQAITDLTARIAALPGAVDLSGPIATAQANAAAINALAQPTP